MQSAKADRPTRKPVLLPNSFQELVQAAGRGQAFPAKGRPLVVHNGVDMTCQLWSGTDLSEIVTAEAPQPGRWMRLVNRWASPTITTLLVGAFGIALRLAAG